MLIIIVIQLAMWRTRANYYDPHVFPSRGPFFEGWYLRLSDPTHNASFGVLFGKVLPDDPAEAANLTFIGLLKTTNQASVLMAHDAFPDVANVELTVDGHPVTKTPTNHLLLIWHGVRQKATFMWPIPAPLLMWLSALFISRWKLELWCRGLRTDMARWGSGMHGFRCRCTGLCTVYGHR